MFAQLGIDIKLAPGQPPEMQAQAVRDAEQAHQQVPAVAHAVAPVRRCADRGRQARPGGQFLREQVQQYREEPKLYDKLAKAYAAQGKIALQHMALAESYVLGGALPAAVDQLNWRARPRMCRSTITR
jgi:predicted Zn-dependent protease